MWQKKFSRCYFLLTRGKYQQIVRNDVQNVKSFDQNAKKEGTSRVPLLRTLCYVSLRRASVYTNHLKDWFPVRTNVTYRAYFLRQKTPNFGAYLRFFDDVFSLHLVCSSVSFGAHLLKIVTFFHFTWCV